MGGEAHDLVQYTWRYNENYIIIAILKGSLHAMHLDDGHTNYSQNLFFLKDITPQQVVCNNRLSYKLITEKLSGRI